MRKLPVTHLLFSLTLFLPGCFGDSDGSGSGETSDDSSEEEGGDGDESGDGDDSGDGDESGDGDDSGVSSWEQIEAAADALNSCSSVSQCRAVPGFMGCSALYVNNIADTSNLEGEIALRNREDTGSEFVSCDASCECGVLACSSGKCVASPGNCQPAAGEQSVCL